MSSNSTISYELVRSSETEIMSRLTKYPEMVVVKDEEQRFLLHWAALVGNEKLCEYILQRHPEQRNSVDYMNATPLILAALGGHLGTVMLLVRSGSDINHRNTGGHSALQYACSRGKLDIVNYLLSNAADVNIQDELKETPLHRATSQGYAEIIDVLLTNKANPNIPNKDGSTPLHLACINDEIQSAIKLLRLGGDRTIVDLSEKTALELASRQMLEALAKEVGDMTLG